MHCMMSTYDFYGIVNIHSCLAFCSVYMYFRSLRYVTLCMVPDILHQQLKDVSSVTSVLVVISD